MQVGINSRPGLLWKLLGGCAAITASACFWFGPQRMTLVDDYHLVRGEDGKTYYLDKGRGSTTGGGAIEGTVTSIGWNDNIILVKRRALFGGDPDGWMVIDVSQGTIAGPISDSELEQLKTQRSDVASITPRAPADVWNAS